MISATELSSYLYCPRKLYLQKVLGIREPVKDVMVRGTVLHATLEHAYEHETKMLETVTQYASEEDVHEQYKTAYSTALRDSIIKHKQQITQVDLEPQHLFIDLWKLVLPESRQRAATIYKFAHTHSLFGVELQQQLKPQIISEQRIESKDLQLKGIVDQIEVHDDKYVPIELKTGSTPMQGVWPGHRIQVGVYMLLTGEKFSTPVHEGIVRYMETQQNRSVVFNPFLELEIKELIEKVMALFESSTIPACEERNKSCEKMFPTETLPV